MAAAGPRFWRVEGGGAKGSVAAESGALGSGADEANRGTGATGSGEESVRGRTGSGKNVVEAFVVGLLDSLGVHNFFLFVLTSHTVRKRVLGCFMLNGIVFLGSLWLLENLLSPAVAFILGRDEGEAFSALSGAFSDLFVVLFHLLWVVPIHVLSFVLNALWYQDIADSAFVIQGRRRPPAAFSWQAFLTAISEQLYNLLLCGCFTLQMLATSFVPHVGSLLYVAQTSWLYAFKCFDYKWSSENWSLEKRISFFERRWSYFLGFGLPVAIVSVRYPFFVSSGLYSLIFPMLIVLSVVARPPAPSSSAHASSGADNSAAAMPPSATFWDGGRLPIFSIAKRLCAASVVALRRSCASKRWQ